MTDLAEQLGQEAARYLHRGDALMQPERLPRWNLAGLKGRLIEISASGHAGSPLLTLALSLVAEAEREGETAVWVTSEESSFFAPDAAEGGINLDLLPVVRVPFSAIPRAADKLARSGAFGLIVLDLASSPPLAGRKDGPRDKGVPAALQSRLLGLAQKHDIAIVFLTRGNAVLPTLGSLISLRGEASRTSLGAGRHEVCVRALKDKRRAPGWCHRETCHGPAGLC